MSCGKNSVRNASNLKLEMLQTLVKTLVSDRMVPTIQSNQPKSKPLGQKNIALTYWGSEMIENTEETCIPGVP